MNNKDNDHCLYLKAPGISPSSSPILISAPAQTYALKFLLTVVDSMHYLKASFSSSGRLPLKFSLFVSKST